jgi:hypothetical protein
VFLDPAHVLLRHVVVEDELRPAFPEHNRGHLVQIRTVTTRHEFHPGDAISGGLRRWASPSRTEVGTVTIREVTVR